MLFYSKPSQYALRALSYVVQYGPEGSCQAEMIASKEKIPKHFLSKILKKLVEAKILNSTKGPGGGFNLAQDPRAVSLIQVIRVFDNIDDGLRECAIGWARCSDEKPCSLHEEYKKLREQTNNYLENVNLANFVEANKGKIEKE